MVMLFLVAGCILSPPQQTRPTTGLPDNREADTILELSIEARGGRRAFADLSHRYHEGKSTSSDGARSNDRFLVDRQGCYWYEGETSEFGRVRNGSDGETYWTRDAQGCKVYDGERRDYKITESAFDAFVDYARLFQTRRVVGTADIESVSCDVIRLTSKFGRDEDWYVNQKTSLVVRVKRQWIVGRTRIDVICDYLDYRAEDGVLVPHTLVQRSPTPNGEFEMRTEYAIVSHTRNKPGPKEFALPDDVSSLIRERATSNHATGTKTPTSLPSP